MIHLKSHTTQSGPVEILNRDHSKEAERGRSQVYSLHRAEVDSWLITMMHKGDRGS